MKRLFIISISFVVLQVNVSYASPILYDFSGTVNWSNNSPTEASTKITGQVSISISYDGNTSKTAGDVSAQIFNGTAYGYDSFLLGMSTNDRSVSGTTFSSAGISFGLRDDPGVIFDNKLLLISLDLMNFSRGSFYYDDTTLSIYNPGYELAREFNGSIDKLTLRQSAPFPEPTTMILLAAGLIGLAGRGKRS